MRPGDRVAVALAGHSIPQLDSVVRRHTERAPVAAPDPRRYHPDSCWRPAPGCDQQFLARLVWLGGRQGLALEGVGAGSWQALLEAGLPPDLLAWLELDAAALEQVPGIGKARANKLAASFARARQRPLAQWLKALGLPAKQLPPEADWDALAARDRRSGKPKRESVRRGRNSCRRSSARRSRLRCANDYAPSGFRAPEGLSPEPCGR